MSRYIDADEIKRAVERWDMQDLYLPVHFLDLLKDVPTADVVELVRCKDCTWWTKQEDSIQGRCELGGFYPTGEWYCANGERGRENE